MGSLLRAGVLADTRLALVAPDGAPGPLGTAVAARAGELGAEVGGQREGAGVLVWDAAAAFGAETGVAAVRAALDDGWPAIRALGAAGQPAQILLLAPPPSDAHAEAARAGLENLARTLSIEWARFGVRPVAILPGPATTTAEVAELAAFLASPAGGYYSGCAFTLGAA